MKRHLTVLSFAMGVLAFGVVACSASEFSGDSGANATKKIGKPKPPKQTDNPSGGNDTPPGTQPPLGVDTNGNTSLVAKQCNGTTLNIVSAGLTCPAGSGVFGIDDPGSGVTYGAMACCPLPSADILKGEDLTRSGSCGANEILVGNANGSLKCRAIDTTKYKLVPASVCYFGTGSSGKGGAPRCGATPAAFSAITSGRFGSDGCLNVPYGSLSVSQTGRNCDNQSAMTLQKIDGTAIEMFK